MKRINTNSTKLLSKAKEYGYGTEVTEDSQQYCALLASLPFWCENKTLHINNPDYQKDANCCINHKIGLPKHPSTQKESPITDYQYEFAMAVIKGRDHLKGDAKVAEPLMIHLNKGRQMGFTELVLRIILHLCFTRYAGANIGIIAATNGSLAKKDLRRLARLFRSIPGTVEQWIKGSTLKLVNDTVIEAFAASEEAVTGDTNYKCIFMDEAAKWKLVDDTPVFNSIMPIVRTNGADLLLVSTPKGPLKMFYEISEDPQDFVKCEFDIWRAENQMYSKEQIEKMLESSTEDPEQEYLCKFKVGKDSIFGSISLEDQQGKTEWLIEEELENDGYVETEQEKNDSSIHWHQE